MICLPTCLIQKLIINLSLCSLISFPNLVITLWIFINYIKCDAIPLYNIDWMGFWILVISRDKVDGKNEIRHEFKILLNIIYISKARKKLKLYKTLAIKMTSYYFSCFAFLQRSCNALENFSPCSKSTSSLFFLFFLIIFLIKNVCFLVLLRVLLVFLSLSD